MKRETVKAMSRLIASMWNTNDAEVWVCAHSTDVVTDVIGALRSNGCEISASVLAELLEKVELEREIELEREKS
jgi:hypothetical protein